METSTLLQKIVAGNALDTTENEFVFAQMLTGAMPESVTAAFLTAWRIRGEGSPLLLAGAREMRQRAAKLLIGESLRPLADNCGTGGDSSGSFNISTAAAIVLAACGCRIAKHGNRSVSS